MGLVLKIGEVKNWDFCHPEALVWIDGETVAGCDKFHQQIPLPARFCDANEHVLALHGYTGRWGYFENGPAEMLFMQQCEVVQSDKPTQDFVALVRVALGTVRALEENCPARGRLLNALEKAFRILETREPFEDAFYNSVPAALQALKSDLQEAGPSLDVNVTAVGHSHIDVAWLWSLAQTRHKCGRSFSTVLSLMDEFGDYRFTQSQPQLYDFVRQDYPELFERIKERVAEDRWEATGGMWVEADCNVTGAESLARQFLLGRGFYAEHFGPDTDTPILWLPDVFGCPYSLPQLIKLAGLDFFYTTKLSWNQYNRVPYDTFWWQGVDGTRVLTHMGTTPPVDSEKIVTYNGTAVPAEILSTWTNCQQKESQFDLMTAFGHGDGGGGPTREMLENVREMADFPGLPRTQHGRAVDFFHKMERAASFRTPTWNGELYLELHRGTYTTQGRNKRANRKAEFSLHDTEWLATVASVLDERFPYPHAQLREAWQLLCLNQFHDILPGSSVGEVYADSLEQYAQIQQIAAREREKALSCVAVRAGGDLLFANPTAFARNDLSLWRGTLGPDQFLERPDGKPVRTQQTEAGTLIDVGGVEPFGFIPVTIQSGLAPEIDSRLKVSSRLLENDHLRVALNAEGDITSLYDKTNNREVLTAGGTGNQFQAFEDRPLDWDAWDIDMFYDDKAWAAGSAQSVRVVESGPLRAALEIKRTILKSEITQRISLAHNSRRLDFETEIDWRERHVLLKAAFPVAVHANEATYEIQWGNIERPTHRNTSWDWARFEVCGHKWIDLSEGNYGVSLLNDCKYGHDVKDNVIRITLLRSPTMPDPEADQGRHTFTYSLLPHAGRWGRQTISSAYALNDPLIVFESPKTPTPNPSPADGGGGLEVGSENGGGDVLPLAPIVCVDRENIVIETVKRAEDNRGIIVRMYESLRQRGQVTVMAGFDLGASYKTNLLEHDLESLDVRGKHVTLSIRPYEIVTLRLIPG